MNHPSSVRRVGLASVACALVLRLFAGSWSLVSPAWLAKGVVFFQTGRVLTQQQPEMFLPDFVESPPAVAGWVLPEFSREQLPQVQYQCQARPDLPALLEAPLVWDLRGPEPKVLILHTHATECYSGSGWEESSPWRTRDENWNMLSIGQALAAQLEEAGLGVIQDRQLHDYPSYNGSYVHARQSLEEVLAQYPSIQLVLDLHRDAAGTGARQMRTLAQVNGADAAQVMVVVGTNYDTYQENLSLGLKLVCQLEALAPGITRPLQLRAQRFNQDFRPGTLLIEIGAAGNSHEEALRAADILGQAIISLSRGSVPGPPGGETRD